MGAKQSTSSRTSSPRVRTFSNAVPHNGAGLHLSHGVNHIRTISLGRFISNPASGLHIHGSDSSGAVGGSPDSDSSIDDSASVLRPFELGSVAPSLPLHLFVQGIKCPVCSKFVTTNDMEVHLLVCLTKPKIIYNEDILTENKGECVICFEELDPGNTIARLPCLCIYHKGCIDKWFEKNRSCPEHPAD